MSTKKYFNISRRKNQKQVWGLDQNKTAIDYSMLDTLSNIATSYEGLETPSLNDLIQHSHIINKELTNKSSLNINRNNKQNNNDSDDDISIIQPKITKTATNKNILTESNNFNFHNINSNLFFHNSRLHSLTINNAQNNEKFRNFFLTLQQNYGTRYQQITKSFIDTLQRFLKAEISEIALISILKYLFLDSPVVLNKFEELTQITAFGTDESRHIIPLLASEPISNVLLSQNLDEYAYNNSLPSNNPDNNKNDHSNNNTSSNNSNNNIIREVDRSVYRDPIKNYLKAVRTSLDPNSFQKFLDALVEFRSLLRLNQNVKILFKKLRYARALLPSSREDLRRQLDTYFPLTENSNSASVESNPENPFIPPFHGFPIMNYSKYPGSYYPPPPNGIEIPAAVVGNIPDLSQLYMYNNSNNPLMAHLQAHVMQNYHMPGLYPSMQSLSSSIQYLDNESNNNPLKRKSDVINMTSESSNNNQDNEIFGNNTNSSHNKAGDLWDDLLVPGLPTQTSKTTEKSTNKSISLLQSKNISRGNVPMNRLPVRNQPPQPINYSPFGRYYNQQLDNFINQQYQTYHQIPYPNGIVQSRNNESNVDTSHFRLQSNNHKHNSSNNNSK